MISTGDGPYAIDCWSVGERAATDPDPMFFGEEEDIPGLLLIAHNGIQAGEYRRVILCKKVAGESPHDWDRLTELHVAT